MNRIIHLRDLTCEIPQTRVTSQYSAALLGVAILKLATQDLRIDNSTGNVFIGGHCVESPREFEPHQSEEEAMRWTFSRFIGNEASKIKQGPTYSETMKHYANKNGWLLNNRS